MATDKKSRVYQVRVGAGEWVAKAHIAESSMAGFAEETSQSEPSALEEEGPELTERQKQLRALVQSSSEEEAAQELGSGRFSVDDCFAVAMDSLRRTNAIATQISIDSETSRREFDSRAVVIEHQLKTLDRTLSDLAGTHSPGT